MASAPPISRDTECFSMNSLMSMRIRCSSESNMNSASALHSSVLPTPVGPRNRNEPIGRFGSCKPARARRTAVATATTDQHQQPAAAVVILGVHFEMLGEVIDALGQNGDLHVKGFAEGYAGRFFELVTSCTGIVSDNATPYIKGVLAGISPLYIAQKGGFNRF